jgi:hypothetical protein
MGATTQPVNQSPALGIPSGLGGSTFQSIRSLTSSSVLPVSPGRRIARLVQHKGDNPFRHRPEHCGIEQIRRDRNACRPCCHLGADLGAFD